MAGDILTDWSAAIAQAQQNLGWQLSPPQTLLSGMPVPTIANHATKQADDLIAELQAKLAVAKVALAAAESSIIDLRRLDWPPGYNGIVPGDPDVAFRVRQAAWDEYERKQSAPNPLANAILAWRGRGGVDQWTPPRDPNGRFAKRAWPL